MLDRAIDSSKLNRAAPAMLAALEMVKLRFDQMQKDKTVFFSVADYKVVARAIAKAKGL